MPRDPRIGMTPGDPCGVGPELCERVLAGWRGPPVRVFGSAEGFAPGRPDRRSARAQVEWLEAAAAAARAGELDALVTGPISKHWAASAGFGFPGQTEFLADRLGASDCAMMMVVPGLRVVTATGHMALREVPPRLSPEAIARAIRVCASALVRDFWIPRPRIGVCGLNPHAGEQGLFGDEERAVVEPGMRAAAAEPGLRAELVGPLAPDTAFAPVFDPPLDAVVALYHDQGLIPIKAMAFHDAVNLTIGLPIVRASPGHGVAYPLAGTGRARADSMSSALRLAFEVASRRLQPAAIGQAAAP